MKRRTLLAAVGAGTVATAGCLDDSRGDSDGQNTNTNVTANAGATCDTDRTYETCSRLLISADSFPEPVRCEIDAALEESGYTTAGGFLLEGAMDVEHAYVRKNDTAYEPKITESASASDDDDERTLTLIEQDRPTRRRVHEMRIENATDDKRTVELAVVREDDDETAVDETLSLEAGERETVPVSDVLGRYEFEVSDDRGLEATLESRLGEYFQFDALVVDDDARVLESTADVAPCPWER
ncbi:hypothetical protein GS429_12655 [Natronorubrum sp. JWXQ-INN-674]|uniref:Uncharacterized protein n=1 Tax=Natronorubrum halalkaliphilum TaxID=2691917 RepID=A0A6B0VQ45_9EURY|nr:hypothetical protein [Natronorubrum halalkaliphilum]MXV62902.1 hypothetical protein [Natronorubrum halalkaliphilum]